MKLLFLFSQLLMVCSMTWQQQTVKSPDGNLSLTVHINDSGSVVYNVSLGGETMIKDSPLGVKADIGDWTSSLEYMGCKGDRISKTYSQEKLKVSEISYEATELLYRVKNAAGREMDIRFRVSNNDIGFRYEWPYVPMSASARIFEEATSYSFPSQTTVFMTPQSHAMIGWKRSKPSYEEEYLIDAPLGTKSGYGHGFTFPSLFRIGESGWVLLCETGVSGQYCGSRLSDAFALSEGSLADTYKVEFPMPEENNGNGTSEPAIALPGVTPWRTITVGKNLAPIAETTIMWDLVEPLYEASQKYEYGRSTWSWIVWQDASCNWDDQIKYIDLAAAMKFQYTLVDAGWDINIGRERMAKLSEYAHSKGTDLFLWYSSSGYWNDIEQTPVNCMDSPIARKKEMKWLKSIGVKGIKVDFFGGDKQETMRLYEAILSDANEYGLMVIFHGCTIPRGWERMYPNYVGSEAVLASENLIFGQRACDRFPVDATLHPFIRNTIGCMEWGGSFLNKVLTRDNGTSGRGSRRVTSDSFEMAAAILFQNPIQNFALTPNNLDDASQVCLDFFREVPTTWDETRLIDGYPGKYVVLARRHGSTWYVAAINATSQKIKVAVDFSPLFPQGLSTAMYYSDVAKKGNTPAPETKPKLDRMRLTKKLDIELEIMPNCGFVVVAE